MDDKYSLKIENIISNSDKLHSFYYSIETFHGPSLYFHRRAINEIDGTDRKRYLELIYAVLSSWGMHRMGPGGSKMVSFELFFESISHIWQLIENARNYKIEDNNIDWDLIKQIFYGIKIMESKTSIVGNSKVMAHLLPQLIPPIDRQYTLEYLRGNKNIKNNLEYEWGVMKDFIQNFFQPIAINPEFYDKANTWMLSEKEYPWDTSIPKIIDNLVISAVKINKNKA